MLVGSSYIHFTCGSRRVTATLHHRSPLPPAVDRRTSSRPPRHCCAPSLGGLARGGVCDRHDDRIPHLCRARTFRIQGFVVSPRFPSGILDRDSDDHRPTRSGNDLRCGFDREARSQSSVCWRVDRYVARCRTVSRLRFRIQVAAVDRLLANSDRRHTAVSKLICLEIASHVLLSDIQLPDASEQRSDESHEEEIAMTAERHSPSCSKSPRTCRRMPCGQITTPSTNSSRSTLLGDGGGPVANLAFHEEQRQSLRSSLQGATLLGAAGGSLLSACSPRRPQPRVRVTCRFSRRQPPLRTWP